MIRFPRSALALAACLLATACAAGPTPSESIAGSLPAAAGGGSAVQSAALADGVVTHDEYQAGFERFVDCAASAGHTITLAGERNEVFDYRMDPSSANSEAVTACYDREFAGVDKAWQLAREDTSEAASLAATCLRKWGLSVPTKFADRVAALERHGIDEVTCDKV